MSVVAERLEIADDLGRGIFPSRLVAILETYKKNRLDPYWRQSLTSEMLLEVALYVQEQMPQAQASER